MYLCVLSVLWRVDQPSLGPRTLYAGNTGGATTRSYSTSEL